MDAAHFILATGFVFAAYLALRSWRRNRVTDRLLRDFARGRKPGANEWIASPQLTALIEEIYLARESARLATATGSLNLEMVLSSMAEGVMVTAADQTIRLVNRSFCEMFGVAGDPTGASVISVLRETVIEDVVSETFRLGEMQGREIAILSSSDSGGRTFQINARTIHDEAGEPTGAVFVFHEVTQIRQLETVRREFVSNVSHELRTPLSIFQGYVENLEEAPDMPAAERREIYAVLRKHSLRLNALIEDLLTLARLESRRVSFDPVSIDLAAFLEGFSAEWESRFAENGIGLSILLPETLPPLRADPLRLEQVLNNLLENAEKFMGGEGHVTLRARTVDDMIEIAVEDDGLGIASQDLPHIFERFYRAEKARNREAGGTGLGLSIVKHIVALHGGSVQARSQLGQGTTILVRWPRGESGA